MPHSTPHVLYGWQDIATYLGCSLRQVHRYQKFKGLPVGYFGFRPRIATRILDLWVSRQPGRRVIAKGLDDGAGGRNAVRVTGQP